MAYQHMYLTIAAVVLVAAIVYMLDPSLGGLMRTRVQPVPSYDKYDREGFEDAGQQLPQRYPPSNPVGVVEDDSDVGNQFSSVAAFDERLNPTGDGGNQLPNGCAPRKQLAPSELLPKDQNTIWSQMNPQGQGDLAGKNFVQAGHFLGIQTQGSSNKNANLQLRADPVIPQVSVSPWMQSTIQPDMMRRGVEIN